MAENAIKNSVGVEFANIIIDISLEKLDKTFQYKIPDELKTELKVGMQVMVPFGNGNRNIKGYIVELTNIPEYEVNKMKYLIEIIKSSVEIESQLIELASFIRKSYGGTMNQALKTVIPVKQKTKRKEEKEVVLLLNQKEAQEKLEEFEKKHNTARVRLLEQLMDNKKLSYELVTKKLNISLPTLRKMESMEIIQIKSKRIFKEPIMFKNQKNTTFSLNENQVNVVNGIMKDYLMNEYNTYLLHGVTGSGKTAVYISLIEKVVKMGKQAIVLIPEIALTFQTLMRFYQVFKDRVSVLNSKMSKGERYEQFMRAKNGELDVMIGPRSALFTPFTKLGFIIIDEEHETSYKSETQPRYHARETAIKRAKLANASVLLGSATPSIESYHNAVTGEYKLFELTKRVDEKPLPDCYVVDLREELKNGNRSILSDKLKELIKERLMKKEQIMLFLNRRGVSSFVSCRACGHVFKCTHCDISLSSHNNGKMVCHYCGYMEEQKKICPVCGSSYVSGFKAGTQKIEQMVSKEFKEAKVLRMDFDTTRNKDGYEKILSSFANHEADILIGTQMIVKGHDFSNVTLVGVLAADLSLNISDFHAPERTFQLLTQAAGRAGRGELPGEVVIQTYDPDHYSIQYAKEQNYKGFFNQEMIYRSMLNYPPIWNLLGILISSKDEMTAMLSAEVLSKKLKNTKEKNQLTDLYIIGPADAPVTKVKDMYKKIIVLKHKDYNTLIKLKDALEQFVLRQQGFKNVYIQFDFNPVNGF